MTEHFSGVNGKDWNCSPYQPSYVVSAGDTSSSGIGDCASLDIGLDDLSQQIVDRLLVKICQDGNQVESDQGRVERSGGRLQVRILLMAYHLYL